MGYAENSTGGSDKVQRKIQYDIHRGLIIQRYTARKRAKGRQLTGKNVGRAQK